MPEISHQSTDAERRMAIASELERLEESAKFSSQSQFEQSKRWRAINLLLGVPASGLAASGGWPRRPGFRRFGSHLDDHQRLAPDEPGRGSG
ncbi:hypothetical protein [Streptomyces rimosus]|uniref:hypothetical protein n=1 Tax=Streptomyces rimosus TaxID=1927 RepID=UPI001ADD8753|nr:hypothetical protein [Streptomyces rimosus]